MEGLFVGQRPHYDAGVVAVARVVVSDMITHRLSLEEVREGFRLASEADDCLKVIIQPND